MKKLPDAIFQSKKFRGKDRFQLAVISDSFLRKSHFKRQDYLWDLLYSELDPMDFIKISVIIPVTFAEAQELTGENFKAVKSRLKNTGKTKQSPATLTLKS